MSSPLQGVRVLDFSRVLAGPYSTMMLADLGADVVKVERPGRGDDTRHFGPPWSHGEATYFLAVNRGKRSIVLDLKDPDDRAQARALALQADVVIENFRPGVMARLGLGPADLRAEKPALIFCSISGFGQDRPLPGYDLVIQGLGGVVSITGEPDGPPLKSGTSIADIVAGMNAVHAVLAALVRKGSTGEGATIDLSMLDGQRALHTYHASAWLNAGKTPQRLGNQHPSIHPYGTYRSADGWVNVAVATDAQFAVLAGVLGKPDLATDARFATNPARVAHRAALDAQLGPALASEITAHWVHALMDKGVPAGAIQSIPEALADAPLVSHDHPGGETPVRTVPLPWRMDGAPRAADLPPPRLGEHGSEVLAEWLGCADPPRK